MIFATRIRSRFFEADPDPADQNETDPNGSGSATEGNFFIQITAQGRSEKIGKGKQYPFPKNRKNITIEFKKKDIKLQATIYTPGSFPYFLLNPPRSPTFLCLLPHPFCSSENIKSLKISLRYFSKFEKT